MSIVKWYTFIKSSTILSNQFYQSTPVFSGFVRLNYLSRIIHKKQTRSPKAIWALVEGMCSVFSQACLALLSKKGHEFIK